ncbi:glycosyltransferase [Bacteroidota bacterium]
MYNVLVLAYYYPPMGLSGVQRTLKFTKYMSEFKWYPTVVSVGDTGYFAHDLSLLKEVNNSEINVIRTESSEINSLLSKYGTITMPPEKIRKLFSRLSKIFFIPDSKKPWSSKAYRLCSELLNKRSYDIIYVTIPPFSAFTVASKLKKDFSIPLIVDYRDMWYDNHFSFYPTFYHRVRHKKLEDNALRNVDHIIVVNRRMKEQLLARYKFLTFSDITIIPHGYDPKDFEIEIEKEKENKLKILYSGIFYENITPYYMLRAFKELSIERPDITEKIELQFVGHFRKENKKIVNKFNLHQNVIDFGYLEHVDVIKKIKKADILWVMLGKGKNMDTVSAGKIFEYFGSRKPIIACVPYGATENAAKEYGASFIVDPYNINDIKRNLIKIYNLSLLNKLPTPNEEFVLKHNRQLLTKELIFKFQNYLKEY